MPSPGKPSGASGENERAAAALFGALSFFLAAIELLVPKPLPFMRLGLANVPLMLAIDLVTFKTFMLVAAVKVAGQALITGTLFSYVFLFSLAGTFVSAFAMYGARRFCRGLLGFTGTGVLGAVMSNTAQLFLARFFVFGNGVWAVVPPFLGMALVTGSLLGFSCELFTQKSRWYAERFCAGEKKHRGDWPRETPRQPQSLSPPVTAVGDGPPPRFHRRAAFLAGRFSAGSLAAAGLLMAPALLAGGSTTARAVQFLFFLLLAFGTGKRVRPLAVFPVMLGIVAVNLLAPHGRVLCSLGPLRVTSGALRAGLDRAFTLEALVMLSRFSVRSDLVLPGFFGSLVSDSFRLFSALSERRGMIQARNIIGSIDALLEEITASGIAISGDDTESAARARKTAPAHFFALALVVILSWLPPLFLR
ncbi:MAG: Gx transporter family protein [Spirochaetaceae bacterium]|jgi:heptaprenyl diphosphate synthase|nr:Gx transporter family protein [Spirochaetaceae bacterium]